MALFYITSKIKGGKNMARIDCYIDHTLCSGAKYSFCDDCKKAQEQKEYKEKVTKARTPAEVSLAHIPSEN